MASRILDKKHLALFASSYFFGILTVIPMIAGLYLALENNLLKFPHSFTDILLFSFIVVGFLAEFTKYLLLKHYFVPKDGIHKPFDGILFSVMISMGFATVANVYFFTALPAPFNLPVVYYSLPVTNLIVGIMLGFFAGIGKFRKNRVDFWTGLGVAIFFQGFYIFGLLAADYLLIALVGTVTLIIAVLLSLRSLNSNAHQTI